MDDKWKTVKKKGSSGAGGGRPKDAAHAQPPGNRVIIRECSLVLCKVKLPL